MSIVLRRHFSVGVKCTSESPNTLKIVLNFGLCKQGIQALEQASYTPFVFTSVYQVSIPLQQIHVHHQANAPKTCNPPTAPRQNEPLERQLRGPRETRQASRAHSHRPTLPRAAQPRQSPPNATHPGLSHAPAGARKIPRVNRSRGRQSPRVSFAAPKGPRVPAVSRTGPTPRRASTLGSTVSEKGKEKEGESGEEEADGEGWNDVQETVVMAREA